MKHAHEMSGADLCHLLLNLTGHRFRTAGYHIATADQAIPVALREIASLSVAFTKVVEGPFRRQSGHQPLLIRRSLVDRFVETTVKYSKKIAHCRLGGLLRLFIGLVDVDVAAKNKIIGSCVPAVLSGQFPVVVEC